MSKRYVIDVSEHQKNIDLKKVKDQGINSVIIRLAWIGNNSFKADNYFEENYKKAKAEGFSIGFYVYNYCTNKNSLNTRIDWIKSLLKNKSFDMPLFIDMEDNSIIYVGKTELTNLSLIFCSRLKQELGVETGVYANKSWFSRLVDVYQLINQNYKIWLAEWNGKDKPTVDYHVNLWQYSSKGQVSGINGNVDMNECLDCNNAKINYLTAEFHMEDYGWLAPVHEDELIGRVGESKRLEAIKLTGTNGLNLEYRVHIDTIGWTNWVKNGEIAGTVGEAKRIEAIEIKSNRLLEVSEHIERVGWMPKSLGNLIKIGTEGKALRLEGFKIHIK